MEKPSYFTDNFRHVDPMQEISFCPVFIDTPANKSFTFYSMIGISRMRCREIDFVSKSELFIDCGKKIEQVIGVRRCPLVPRSHPAPVTPICVVKFHSRVLPLCAAAAAVGHTLGSDVNLSMGAACPCTRPIQMRLLFSISVYSKYKRCR